MKIYISSTYEDLKEYRDVLYKALRKTGEEVIAMEDYTTSESRPLDKCLADVASSDIYIGIFALRYGFIPSDKENNPSNLSITELEYLKAGEVGINRLIFLLDENIEWALKFVDGTRQSGVGDENIFRFRNDLKQRHIISFFKTPDELAKLTLSSLSNLIRIGSEDDYEQFGLRLIPQTYFKKDIDTTEDFEKWKDGFPLHLESIYQKREYRRTSLLKSIKNSLQDKKRFLILGPSGTSKTTLLMELICDYFDEGYRVLYNLGDIELRSPNDIVEGIKRIILSNNNVLIVVDEVHNPKVSVIFNIIDKLSMFKPTRKCDILFLLAAKQPDFDLAIERGSLGDANVMENIDRFFDMNSKLVIPYFKINEIKEFLIQYEDYLPASNRIKEIDNVAKQIYDDTQGYPILVRFAALNSGLETHAKRSYREYLVDTRNENKPHQKRISVFILSSIFDISSVVLRDSILEENDLIDEAYDLQDNIIKKENDMWKTINSKWDFKLYDIMFSFSESNLRLIRKWFSNMVKIIIKNPDITNKEKLSILNTIYYTLVKETIIQLEDIINMIDPNEVLLELDNQSKLIFFSTILGFSYQESDRYSDAIAVYDKALEIDQNHMYAINNKGIALFNSGLYVEAIAEYDKALEIDPRSVKAHYNKGLGLSKIGKNEEAITEYDKALEIDQNHVYSYYYKGLALSKIGKNEEAITEYDKALEIDQNHVYSYYYKGLALSKIGKNEEAITEYDKALEIDPRSVKAHYNKGLALSKIGKNEEAITEYDKALEIDQNLNEVLLAKIVSLVTIDKKTEATENLKKSLVLDPRNPLSLQLRDLLQF